MLPRTSSLAAPTRSEFSIADFTKLVDDYGYDVKWSKFMVCPNYDPEQTDHHFSSCTFCDHAGRVLYDVKKTKMIASSFDVNPKYQPQSRYDMGTVYFTTYPTEQPSFRDRIELLVSRMRYSERVVLNSNTTYAMRFPVLNVYAILSNRNAFVDLSTVTVNAQGSITFKHLPVGEVVTVSYDHHPVYTVVDLPHGIRDSRVTDSGMDIPAEFNRQVAAQLEILSEPDPNVSRNTG